jgi:hypothetical protein
MKFLKAICAVAILALAFSVPVYAGDVETPGKPNPFGTIRTPNLKPETTETLYQLDTEASIAVFSQILWALASIY